MIPTQRYKKKIYVKTNERQQKTVIEAASRSIDTVRMLAKLSIVIGRTADYLLLRLNPCSSICNFKANAKLAMSSSPSPVADEMARIS